MKDNIIKSQMDNVEIDPDHLHTLLRSSEFTENLATITELAYETLGNYGLASIKEFGKKSLALPPSELNDGQFPSDQLYKEAPADMKYYVTLEIMAHSSEKLLPDEIDILSLLELTKLDRISNIISYPISGIARYITEEKRSISVTLYQIRHLEIIEETALEKILLNKKDEIRSKLDSDNSPIVEDIFLTRFYRRILMPNFNIGIITYVKENKEWTLNPEGMKDMNPDTYVPLKDMFRNFSYHARMIGE